ncbi:MAG: preprotein translocase subunit YajC [Candidatus Zixiibacteriota bacterium]|nr:MAG: preprotein translocase subunit YajC [candidate division Zixibacteria bacterium]
MAQPGEGGGGGGMAMLLMFALIFLVMYFFMIRPQQKREKTRQKMISELKKGDRVVTNSGIIGSVWGIKDTIVVLKVYEDVKLEVLKTAVASKIE